jgi:uncharacterized protein YndB with AHSA1/START domain
VTARRSRVIEASAEAVWSVVSDPYHFPRWWPGVDRVEGVHDDRFTEVHTTHKGRAMRMDFRMLVSEPPAGETPGRLSFEQELPGSPWERFLTQSSTEIVLAPHKRGTEITIAQEQKLRGYSRAGGALFFRRAMSRRLDEALEGLARVCDQPR